VIADDVQKILLSEEQISAKVAELGAKITADYAGCSLVVVCILKGAVLFTGDLIRHIKLPLSVDFMAISSYGMETKSSGVVRILKDLDASVEGRHVLVVEDIVDSGLTLKYLEENLRSRRPASLAICALLDKATRRKIEVKLDYRGFVIPDEFVVGYGLDYAEKYRNLPFIGVLKPEIYGG
jgi:hypoxanthine phosphoribosyltransferase